MYEFYLLYKIYMIWQSRSAFDNTERRPMGECSMAEDTKTDLVVATGEWGPPTTQREAARSQMLWMVGQASRAAKSGRVDDARWWRERAVSALWNMN